MKQEKKKQYRLYIGHWHILRVVYLIGGIFVFGSALLALFFDERWLYFTIFVGFMLINFALTGYCPMAFILDKCGVRRE